MPEPLLLHAGLGCFVGCILPPAAQQPTAAQTGAATAFGGRVRGDGVGAAPHIYGFSGPPRPGGGGGSGLGRFWGGSKLVVMAHTLPIKP